MHKSTKDALEEIDAAIFSGDVLFTDFEEVVEYVERWQRAIDEHEEMQAEAASEDDEES